MSTHLEIDATLVGSALAALDDETTPVRERIAAGVEAACTLVPWADFRNLHMGELGPRYLEALGIRGMPLPPVSDFELEDQIEVVDGYFASVWVDCLRTFLIALREHGPIPFRDCGSTCAPTLRALRGGAT